MHPRPLAAAIAVACMLAMTSAIALAEEGMASWYGSESGSRRADGRPFRPDQIGCAHRHLPLGTMVTVTDRTTGRSIRCAVNDRGPYVRGRILDLSRGAAVALFGADRRGRPAKGLARVRVTR